MIGGGDTQTGRGREDREEREAWCMSATKVADTQTVLIKIGRERERVFVV